MGMASRVLAKRMERESRRGDVERIASLIRDGADVDSLRSDGMTPLMRAAYHGHRDAVRLLLDAGADPNKTAHDGASALFWACVRGHDAIAKLLLVAGADVNATRRPEPPREGKGPSVLAAAIGRSASAALVEMLVAAGASIDHRYLGWNMREYAAWCGREDLIPLLVQARPPGRRGNRP